MRNKGEEINFNDTFSLLHYISLNGEELTEGLLSSVQINLYIKAYNGGGRKVLDEAEITMGSFH